MLRILRQQRSKVQDNLSSKVPQTRKRAPDDKTKTNAKVCTIPNWSICIVWVIPQNHSRSFCEFLDSAIGTIGSSTRSSTAAAGNVSLGQSTFVENLSIHQVTVPEANHWLNGWSRLPFHGSPSGLSRQSDRHCVCSALRLYRRGARFRCRQGDAVGLFTSDCYVVPPYWAHRYKPNVTTTK